MDKAYAAHISENGDIQTIKTHLFETAKLAKLFAESFNNPESGYICGLLHDIGKYSKEFQKRIHGGKNIVDHSTAGAIEVHKNYQTIGTLLAYCLAGHHAGLPDGGSLTDTEDSATLHGRLKRIPKPYSQFSEEINDLIQPRVNIKPLGKQGFSAAFYVRMLFSCLVDADFLDTEAFMNGVGRSKNYDSIAVLKQKLQQKLKELENPENEINIKRNDILNQCINKASSGPGLYTLTVPTGGGKTLTSLAFALNHAEKQGMNRIIYVIPYNSIIEQNAAVFKDALGEKNVLEHHSGFNYDSKDDVYKPQRLASESWDMPIIVTTTVQFFESLFANRTSRCRKLHNIANSVIIFDEAQLLPTKYLLPCIRVIAEIVYNYRSTAVLCSATQPALGKRFPEEIAVKELCENTGEMYKFFNQTSLKLIGSLSDAELAQRLNSQKQVLCIVNTRKQAQNVFRLLEGEGAYHLSTLMYPDHRKEVLETIRKRLKDGQFCRVVSTSLIEAGVDVDFPVVYRAKAGLDSMIQAAGRCNRERKRDMSPVYVFDPDDSYNASLLSVQKRPIAVTESIINRFDDITSPEAIKAYFEELYRVVGDALDEQKIVKRFEEGIQQNLSFPFATVAKEFRLIDQVTHPIFIPDGKDAEKLYDRMSQVQGERSRELLRSIQRYTVNVYDQHYAALNGAGYIEILDEEIAVLTVMNKYSKKTGLDVLVGGGQAIFG